tara:strand:+ start:228 stop:329 length:102 start_codon:yes stop_codon:yes gene_type:complete
VLVELVEQMHVEEQHQVVLEVLVEMEVIFLTRC